jgi:hypothetical protein
VLGRCLMTMVTFFGSNKALSLPFASFTSFMNCLSSPPTQELSHVFEQSR